MIDQSNELNKNLDSIINDYFDEISYYNLYNFDIWITIIIIFVVLMIVIYFFSINTLENQKLNFEKNKCNPLFMPFASTLNPEYANDPSFNQKNFEQCLNEINFDVASYATSPLDAMFESIMVFFKKLGGVVSNFMGFLMYLSELLYKVYESIIERLKHILSAINNLFIGIIDFFNNILGIVTNLYYTLILLVDSLKYVFTVIALSFFSIALLPSIIATTSAFTITVVTFLIASGFHMLPISPFGPTFALSFLWGIYATALIVFLIALSITIVFSLLYGILSNFAGELISNGPGFRSTTSSRDPGASGPVGVNKIRDCN